VADLGREEAGRQRQRDRLERGECASSSQKHSKRAGDAERRNKKNNKGLAQLKMKQSQ
jgi:hypothetical protein